MEVKGIYFHTGGAAVDPAFLRIKLHLIHIWHLFEGHDDSHVDAKARHVF
jgi:hypothetical protein